MEEKQISKTSEIENTAEAQEAQEPTKNLKHLNSQESYDLWRKLSNYGASRWTSWHAECLKNRAFYYGQQVTQAEADILEERGQYNIVINKIRKSIRGIVGLVSAALPKYRLVPVGDGDEYTAALGNKLLDWSWQHSGGIQTFRTIVKNALVDNIGYFYVFPSSRGIVKFQSLTFDDVLVDPASKLPMFEDSEMIIIRKYVPTTYIKQTYGIDPVYQMPEPVYGETGIVSGQDIEETATFTDFMSKVFSTDKTYCMIYTCFSKVYEYNPESMEQKARIKKQTVLGFNDVYETYLPEQITEYPIIPVYVEKGENPYTKGEVFFLTELQRFINKAFGVSLLNAQLMSNPKIFMSETDIPGADLDTFEQHYSRPGSINIMNSGANPPIVVQGQPLNTAFFTLYQEAKMEMEYNTIPNQMLGITDSDKASIGQGDDALGRKETALDAYKDFTSNLDMSCTQVAKVVLQFDKAYLTKEKIVRLVDDTGKTLEQFKLNIDVNDEKAVQQYIRQKTQAGVPEQQVIEELAQVKQTAMKAESINTLLNQPDFEDYDVYVVPGSYTPTYNMAILKLLMTLGMQGAFGGDPTVYFDYLPLENKKELKERFDLVNQLKQQLMQNSEDIKNKDQIINQLTSAIIRGKIDLKTQLGSMKIEKMQNEQKLKAYFAKWKDQLMTKEKMMELEKDISKYLSDLQMNAMQQELQDSGKSESIMGMTIQDLLNIDNEGDTQ